MIMLQDNNIDIACISETWLTENTNCTTALIKSYGFNIIHTFRSIGRGGGTAIIHRFNLISSVCNFDADIPITSFGYTSTLFKLAPDIKLCLVCVYRTGPVTKLFFREFNHFIQAVVLKSDYVIVAGDFNINLEINDAHANNLSDLMESYGFSQIVKKPTHNLGGTIDLIFDNSNLLDVETLHVEADSTLSDHFPITCSSKIISLNQVRALKSVDRERFSCDIYDEVDSFTCSSTLEESLSNYTSRLSTVFNLHAPLEEKTISYMPHAPWFDNEYKQHRILRRKAERLSEKKNASDADKRLYDDIKKETTKMSNLKKQEYYRTKIENNKKDIKAIYDVLNKEMDRKQGSPLPDTEDVKASAKDFNEFFIQKIQNIRKALPLTYNDSMTNPHHQNGCIMSTFEPTTVAELKEIIKESGIKSSPSDILPTELLKENIDILLPTLCDLVNLSLSTGSMDGLKVADVIPTIKGFGNDPNEKKNYRPISNLTFLGKLVERVVLRQLNAHLDKHNLNIPNQSAHRKNHSTKKILIKVINDLLMASDKNTANILMLLDLSAAFDTVDHNILLR